MSKELMFPMVNLNRQYHRLKEEINTAIKAVLSHGKFIDGPEVSLFAEELSDYLDAESVVPCANGTDALQIALMALDLPKGSEVMVPAFTYAASAEAILLLGYKPCFVDVSEETFNMLPASLESSYTEKCKAIIVVHLFGQPAPMEDILSFAEKKGLYVIEDNAQAIGARYSFSNGDTFYTGTMGHIGCTSFFPSKNLGAYGDGGALIFGKRFPESYALSRLCQRIAHHGQTKKYYHEVVGCNSRLDTIQAAILRVKLSYLNEFNEHRRSVANWYQEYLKDTTQIGLPMQQENVYHVFHQYTIRLRKEDQNLLVNLFNERALPYCIYFPSPLHKQDAYLCDISLPISEKLSNTVFSLPICSDITREECYMIGQAIRDFYKETFIIHE